MESVKKSIDERAQHKREYDSRVKERHIQTKEEKVDSSKALNVGLVITESNRTKSNKQDTSSKSGNDINAPDADIRIISNEEPRDEVDSNTTPDSTNMGNNGGEIDHNAKNVEADDQAIQTIILGLPEEIYDVVDSCKTAQEIWLRVQQMVKGSDIGIQEKKG
nr:hypothetical protein [Tanacetum cinerariifolium]